MLSILLAIIYTVQAAHKGRKEQFSRITKYELLHLNPQDTSNPDIKTLSFDMYNQHYSIELQRNHDMIPSYTQHYNIDPTTHKHQYFSSLKESCHYQGRVLNTNSKSLVAISLCPNRGIRGTIEAFNQTLIIQPSAYYLDLQKDKYDFHNINDEVLIYKLSDFNTSDVVAINAAIIDKNKKAILNHNNNKRRLYTEANPAKVEEMIVTGPVRIKNYQDDHGDKWYQELHAKYTDMINEIDAIYKATNWGSSVGGENAISVVFSGMHVIFDFTDDYSSLAPQRLYSNCGLASGRFDDSDLCAINGNQWLGTIKTWVNNYMDFSKFDNVQFVSDMKFKWERSGTSTSRTLGWGYIGTVCTGSSVTDVSIVPDMGGETNGVRTMAHELGHNFNMEHDGQSGAGSSCAANAGLMGYSDGTGFSRCSIASIQEYFSQANGLTCLGNGWPRDFISNHDDGQSAAPTKRPTTYPTRRPTERPTNNPTRVGQTESPTKRPTDNPTTRPTDSTPSPTNTPTPPPVETSCIRISGISQGLYDGTYNELSTTHNGASVYQLQSGNAYYIYKPNSNSYWNVNGGQVYPSWVWGDSIGSGTISMYCTETNIMNCGGKFTRYTGTWVTYPQSTIDTQCGTAETCPGYNCVGVAGVGQFSGQFTPAGCYNERKYYTNNGGGILCYSPDYSRWIITRELCSPYTGTIVALSGRQTTDVVGNGWYVATDSSSLSYSSNVMVNDCGGGGALNIGDLECLNNNKYDDSLCVVSNNTIWTGQRTFELYDKLCKNDAPIYHFTVRNTTNDGFVVDGLNLNDENQIVYYLHFHREKRFIDSNETVGQWLISKNEISVNSIAVCQQDNLLDCTASNWKVESTQYGDFALDGLILRITDKHMSVSNGECANEEFDSSKNENNEWIIIIVVVLLLIVCGIIIYFVWKKMSENESNRIKQSLGKHTQTATEKPMEDEMQQEIEIEVSMEKNITQTED